MPSTSYSLPTPAPAPTKMLGISQPISLDHPTKEDLTLTQSLLDTLHEAKSFESLEESKHRIKVLCQINQLVKQWIAKVTKIRIPDREFNGGGKLMAFGSYRLGVHSSGSDIDTLVVAPRHVTRQDFFSSFKDLLLKDPKCKELNAVEQAFVPIMTMTYDGVDIDLLFARMDVTTVPDDMDLSNDSLLKNLDQESVRSLNGCRVAGQLLKLVPNQESFCTVLRAIKIWAQNHGVYSNAMGFFGGITWAILVARTCQLYPNASASRLIQKVFFVFSTWQWPQPVLLNHASPSTGTALDKLVWDPRCNHGDRFHLMPILTPAYPEQNSTHNVSRSSLTVIQNELKKGLEVCNQILAGTSTWKDLLKEVCFFESYLHYVALTLDTPTEKDEASYGGFFESKIRQFVQILERNPQVEMVQVNPKKFKKTGTKTSVWIVGFQLVEGAKNVDLSADCQRFQQSIYQQAMNVKNIGNGIVDATYVKRGKLISYISAAELSIGRTVVPKKKKRPASSSDESEPAAKKSPES